MAFELTGTTTDQFAGLLTASEKTAKSAMGLAQNFESFLSLLTTQLQNQDPLAPMDATKFTEQLVQFSSVEQAVNTNSKLDQLLTLQSGSQAVSAVGFIGKDIEAFGESMALTEGSAAYVYKLPQDATTVTVAIKDESGRVIRTISNAPSEKGTHSMTWDGKDDQGNSMNDGRYSFAVTAKDADKNSIDAITGISGRVRGVTVRDGVVVLDLGNGQTVKVTDVFTVRNVEDQAPEDA